MIKSLLLILVLASACAAQTATLKKSDFLKPAKRDIWKPYSGVMSITSSAVCFGGSVADIVSSQGLQERNPFFRNSHGQLDNRKALLSFAPCGVSYAFERKHPKTVMIFRFAYGGIKTGLAIRNWNVPKQR